MNPLANSSLNTRILYSRENGDLNQSFEKQIIQFTLNVLE